MKHEQVQWLKGVLRSLWALSPERLWLTSIALHRRGHWVFAFLLKQLNGFLYHNSLAPGATVSPDIFLGHNSLGVVINGNVEIGRRVSIWHNVTLAAGRPERPAQSARMPAGAPLDSRDGAGAERPDPDGRARIVIEDGVTIGSNVVVIAPRGRTLHIGRGARIGAGTVVTKDVPPRSTVVGAAPRVIARERSERHADERGEG